jgi:molybdopterin-binding protein
MQISARNVLKGQVKRVVHGVVNSEVIIQIAGGQEIVAVISRGSAEKLALAQGKEVYAVIKSTNVLVAVD